MKKAITLLSIIMALFSVISSAEAFSWKPKHFKGFYVCTGASPSFTWAAGINADGLGGFEAVELIGTPKGLSDPIETQGHYVIETNGLIDLQFGAGMLEGVLVQRGQSVMFLDNLFLFEGNCWKQK